MSAFELRFVKMSATFAYQFVAPESSLRPPQKTVMASIKRRTGQALGKSRGSFLKSLVDPVAHVLIIMGEGDACQGPKTRNLRYSAVNGQFHGNL
jgi:hypothetical protein